MLFPLRPLHWLGLVLLLTIEPVQAAGSVVAQVRSDGAAVRNAVVYAEPLDGLELPWPDHPTAIMDQVDKEFVPHVLAVLQGTSVRFPNSDETRHQVYSFSQTRTFELDLYAGSDADPVTFDRTGVVTLGCNIHDWMLGYIRVLDTPAFDRTDDAGRARLDGLPAGRYRVRLWHPRLKAGRAPETHVAEVAGDTVKVRFDLALTPPPDRPQRGFGDPGDDEGDDSGFGAY